MSTKQTNRPLSPHLQVWKWSFTMALSIFHRASGIALVAGMLMVVWMLVSAASGEVAYDCFLTFSKSIIGQIILFGFTGTVYYHLCSGVRHLIMDMGYGITIAQAEKAGKIMFIVAIALTLATWGALKLSNGGM
jgi:succinate dehydrogenase / fumarate reductase cytochrome b subunit